VEVAMFEERLDVDEPTLLRNLLTFLFSFSLALLALSISMEWFIYQPPGNVPEGLHLTMTNGDSLLDSIRISLDILMVFGFITLALHLADTRIQVTIIGWTTGVALWLTLVGSVVTLNGDNTHPSLGYGTVVFAAIVWASCMVANTWRIFIAPRRRK
jgi:hypothetical protein